MCSVNWAGSTSITPNPERVRDWDGGERRRLLTWTGNGKVGTHLAQVSLDH